MDKNLLEIQLDSKISKLEVNPFNKHEFIAVFRSYFLRFDFNDMSYESIYCGNRKIEDFYLSKEFEGEFLLAGDVKGDTKFCHSGYLNLYRMV